ncbi:MAG TPA: ribosome biogenesis GTPase Der [Bacilli bacterium]|jgi:GTP-binding protein|nr:ribosome biogenesis GTPase Der [Acholeplasmataceae bacterium]HNZ77664.1 ribosome biogenesis GTPase Der [Bacilli bacterium]HOD60695.1 ribosome biogenesis GTPase Der [Bacilli bacterium]HOH61819.1 ribosome biogenesis GTPase Der [Bacilli bacterium]HPB49057.1 ribosome biogenesis GTPase Der [Bacilli bacterium]
MRGVVAIVGRPNVGKSSLFNRIIGDRVSITDDASGITRDRIYGKASWLNQEFRLIDTGGIILKDEPFSKEIRAQASLAIDEADVIIMVVDVRASITIEDEDVINILYRSNKPVIIAVNKVDNNELLGLTYDFYSLGIGDIFPVSALHGIGIGDLLDRVIELLPEERKDLYGEGTIKFCLIGQPNVGKSTLSNTIVGEERTIVSSIPGTTRDAIDIVFTRNARKFVVIDTAGIRKQGKIYENAEKYSVLRALSAIERSDIAVLILDGTEELSEQDKRIAGYAREANRAIIIVVNKWDIVVKDDKTMQRLTEKIKAQMPFLDFAPIIFLSAYKKERVHTLLDEIVKVYENFNRRVQTSVLNDVLLDAVLLNQPPVFNGNRLRLNYATQEDVMPPSFVLFVNDEKHMHFSYLRYLENKLRESFDFSGSPIKFILRKKE